VLQKYKEVIGSDLRHIKLVPYNPLWPEIFFENKARLEEILKGINIQVEHIGSTSLPTVRLAKPIIDIAIINQSEVTTSDIVNIIKRHGFYKNMDCVEDCGSLRVTEPNNKEFTYNYLDVDRPSNKSLKYKLAFKRYMLEHPYKAEQYSQIKEEAIKKSVLYNDYIHSKEEFISQITDKARALYLN